MIKRNSNNQRRTVSLTPKNDFVIRRVEAINKKLDLNKNSKGYGIFSKIMNDALDQYFKKWSSIEKEYLISELSALQFIKDRSDQQHKDKVERFKSLIRDIKVFDNLKKATKVKKSRRNK